MKKLTFAAIAAMILVSVSNAFAYESSMRGNATSADTTQTDTVKTDTTVTSTPASLSLQADTTGTPTDTMATK